tara:strand:- start:993 stop:1316 length:324 start_codon:yes stop_codon:yes gene_type:complete
MDDATKIAEEMLENHKKWDALAKKNQRKWLSEYKELLSDGKMFWGTDFSTYSIFKVFEHAFEDMIDECYDELSDGDNITRTEVAYGLFGEVVENSDIIGSLKGGAEA